MSSSAYLILSNGKIFKGTSFGAEGTVIAEAVFTTAMAGYLETLTDDSYYGQAVVQAYPLIGGYDAIADEIKNKTVSMSAYIVKSWCKDVRRDGNEGTLDALLKEKGVIGVCDIDTRALVKEIRENGAMNAMVTTEMPEQIDFDKIATYRIENAVKKISVKEPMLKKTENAVRTVAVMDMGEAEGIVAKLNERGCDVWVVPCDMSAKDITALKVDGVVISAGPGNPEDNAQSIATVTELAKAKMPMLGIAMGHQIMALANGFKTYKMKHGHRSANQPVRDGETGKIYITSQNHGYAVDAESIDEGVAKQLFDNVNDTTCEGIEYLNTPAFSVQFDIATCSGPKEASFLFDKFMDMMNK